MQREIIAPEEGSAPHASTMRERRQPPLTLVVLGGFVVPGLGHFLTRQSRRWRTLTIISSALVGLSLVGAIMCIFLPFLAAGVLFSTGIMLAASILAIAWAVFASAVAIHLLITLRRDGKASLPVTAFTLAFVLLICSASVGLSVIASQQRMLINNIFADGPALNASNGRYNILIAGIDIEQGRDKANPDSIALASIDAFTGQTVIFGIPRTTQAFFATADHDVNKEGCLRNECAINRAYQYGEQNPDLFPGTSSPGMASLSASVTDFTGLEVSGYVTIKMAGLIELIDDLGGVTITVNKEVPRAGVPVDIGDPITVFGEPIPTGTQHMDGETALWFARSRLGSTDEERMQRQACLEQAIVSQVDPFTIINKFTSIVETGAENIETNVPSQSVGVLATLGTKAATSPLNRIDLVPQVVGSSTNFDFTHSFVDATIHNEPLPQGVFLGLGVPSAPDVRAASGVASASGAIPQVSAHVESVTPTALVQQVPGEQQPTGEICSVPLL